MSGTTREIKRRIKSISNTKKITKAMEMVSAAKMRKAMNKLVATRPYSQAAWDAIIKLTSNNTSIEHPLINDASEIKKVGLIVITSNRGLCGGFNTKVIKRSIEHIKEQEGNGVEVEIITIGKKGRIRFGNKQYNLVADFEKKDVVTSLTEVYGVTHLCKDKFTAGTYQKVYVSYMHYETGLIQTPRVKQIMPVRVEEKLIRSEKVMESDYILEPNDKFLLDSLLPKIIDIHIYRAMIEAEASEHSARMMAMKSAHDAAGDMIKSLKRIYNKARQASITQEISEISAGKAALEEV